MYTMAQCPYHMVNSQRYTEYMMREKPFVRWTLALCPGVNLFRHLNTIDAYITFILTPLQIHRYIYDYIFMQIKLTHFLCVENQDLPLVVRSPSNWCRR